MKKLIAKRGLPASGSTPRRASLGIDIESVGNNGDNNDNSPEQNSQSQRLLPLRTEEGSGSLKLIGSNPKILKSDIKPERLGGPSESRVSFGAQDFAKALEVGSSSLNNQMPSITLALELGGDTFNSAGCGSDSSADEHKFQRYPAPMTYRRHSKMTSRPGPQTSSTTQVGPPEGQIIEMSQTTDSRTRKKSHRKRRKKGDTTTALTSLCGVTLENHVSKPVIELVAESKLDITEPASQVVSENKITIEPLPLEPLKDIGRRHEMFPGVSRRLIRTKKLAKNLIKEGISGAMEIGPSTMRPRSGTLFSQLAVLKRKKKYDRTPHEIFVQLDQFASFGVGDGQGLWLEKARWIKYEENMDWEGPLRWGKPHVPILSFHSLLDLRQQIMSGTVIFDLKCDDYESFVTYVLKSLRGKDIVTEEESTMLKQTLFAPHKFPHTSQLLKFMAIQNWLSTQKPQWARTAGPVSNQSSNVITESNGSDSKGSSNTPSQRGIRRSSSTPAFARHKKRWASRQNPTVQDYAIRDNDRVCLNLNEIRPSSGDTSLGGLKGEYFKTSSDNVVADGLKCLSDGDECNGRGRKNNSDPAVRALSHLSSLAFLRLGLGQSTISGKVADISRRIPAKAEAASILVGTVPYLNKPLSVFVRLTDPLIVTNLKNPPSHVSAVKSDANATTVFAASDSSDQRDNRRLRGSGSQPEFNFSTSLLEVPTLPVRFIYLLLGPQPKARRNSDDLLVSDNTQHHEILGDQESEIDYYDLGRCFCTLMANKFFQDIAYQATHCRELVLAFNEFLNESVVLPAGQLNASTLLPLTRLYKDRMLKNLPKPHHHAPTLDGRRASKDSSSVKEQSVSSIKSPSASSTSSASRAKRNRKKPTSSPFCPIFKGLKSDINNKKSWYFSDFRDAGNSKCLLAILFIYLTSMPPSVTFGGLLSEKTDNWIGVSEIMVADCLGGIVFSLFAGQPLMILTVTGPLLVFEESLYQFTQRYEIDYIAFRFWIGLWVALITVCFVAFDGSRLIKYFSRFIEEIFALTIALVFIYEVLKKIYKLFKKYPLYAQYCHLTLSAKKIGNKSFVAFQNNLMLTDSYIPIQKGSNLYDQLRAKLVTRYTKAKRAQSSLSNPNAVTIYNATNLGPLVNPEKPPKLFYFQHDRPSNRSTALGTIPAAPALSNPVHPIFYRGTLRRFYNYYYNNVTDPRTPAGPNLDDQSSSIDSVLLFYTPAIRYHDINFTQLYDGVARAPDGHLILDRDFARCKVIRPNTALFSTLLLLATFFAAFFLRRFRSEGKFLTRTLRRTLGDFGPPIALLASACVDTYGVGLDVYTEKLNLHSGPPVSPTLPDRRGWLVYPLGEVQPITYNAIGLAFLPAAMLFILLFVEGQLTALLVNKRQRKLRKSHGYHLDLLVIGLLQIPMGALGLPWISPAPIQSLAHVACLSIYNTREHAPGERPTVLQVKEQRVTSLLISLAMGLTLVFGSGQLQKIPVASLFGVFLYLGVSSLTGIQFYERLTLLITSPKYYPRTTNAAYIRKVSYPKIHLYTFIQFSCLALLWALKFTPLSLFFPLVLLSIVPLRYRLGCLFSKQELYYLDMEEEEVTEDELDFYTEAHMPV